MRSILGHIAITVCVAFSVVNGAHSQIVFADLTEEAAVGESTGSASEPPSATSTTMAPSISW